MTAAMQRSVRRIRQRAAVRAWEYRQRRLSKGVWFRLRRVLADSAEAYEIPEQEAARLIDEGFRPEPIGAELSPSKSILFIPADRALVIAGRRAVPVALGAELLDADFLVLVRFP